MRLQVVAAGASAGLISRFVIAPLDVVKIRLQLQSHLPPSSSTTMVNRSNSNMHQYRGTFSTLRHIIAHEGPTALWKGNIPAELMYVSYAAIQFTVYRSITLLVDRTFGPAKVPKPAESFVSGAGAGAAATAATYPLDLLRTRFAAQGCDRVYPGLARAVLDIQRDEGVRGFFRGVGPALGQIVPFMGLFFALYEGLRARLGHVPMPVGSGDAVAGVIASTAAKTAVFPLDLVRKRIQVQGPTRAKYAHKNIPAYDKGALRALRTIVATEGFRGLYRGLGVGLAKAAPTSAVTMWTYERVLGVLVQYEIGGGGMNE